MVVVQYYQSTVQVCKQMRLYFTRLSGQPNYQKVIFAEVDVEELQVRSGLVEARLSGRGPGMSPGWVAAAVRQAAAARAGMRG